MSSILSSLTDLTKDKGGEAIAFGLGFALGHVLDPPATALSQESWTLALEATSALGKALDPATAAEVVAEQIKAMDWGKGEAAQTGIAGENFATIVELALVGPGLPALTTLRRRGEITDEDFVHGLRKLKLEPRWDKGLTTLIDEKLDVAVIATAVQRGIIANSGILPVGAPTGVGRVPPMPVSDLDPIAEAAATGYDQEHLAILARIVGLPPSPDMAARMTFRNIIDRVDFDRAISEGNTRNEWRDFMYEASREILTAHNWVELHLRGWVTAEEMYAGTAQHGMTVEDTDHLFRVLGRPIPVHQITTGEARGGVYNGPIDHIPEAYLASLRQGNERPEWYNLSYANRYTYPSAFVIRALAEAGDLSKAETEQVLLNIGWPPDFAAKISAQWAGTKTVTVGPYAKKATTTLYTSTHKFFVHEEGDETTARETLTALGAIGPEQDQVIETWKHERNLIRALLTPAQIKKAYHESKTLPPGEGFTREQALALLERRGYSAADAATLLDE